MEECQWLHARVSYIPVPCNVLIGVVLGTITANGVVTVSGDKATLTLNATAEGTFQCSLDGGTFQSCMHMFITMNRCTLLFISYRPLWYNVYWRITWVSCC